MSAPLPERLEAHEEFLHDENEMSRGGLHGEATSVAEDKALAAEIARRWNAHAALVTALREVVEADANARALSETFMALRRERENVPISECMNWPEHAAMTAGWGRERKSIDAARAALRAAKGEA